MFDSNDEYIDGYIALPISEIDYTIELKKDEE